MSKIFHPLLIMLAGCTEKELARQVQYLTEENRILRAKLPKRITVTSEERRSLLKFGKPVGKAIKELITIVTPRTFARWVAAEKKTDEPKQTKKAGRPRTPEEIRELVVNLAKETGWGYTKILGELRKLGIRKITRQTVKNILKEHGFDRGPKRGKGTWDEFLKIHAETLWQCDFFSKKVWTLGGLVEMYVLAFIHVGSRRVWVSSPTAHPDGRWVAQQARNVCMEFAEEEHKPTDIIHDADTKFTKQFDEIFEDEGIRVKKLVPASLNMNAFIERWVQSIKQECLDHFVVLGEKHLQHIVSEYVSYYNNLRPHENRDHLPPALKESPPEVETICLENVVCRERLGGLLKHYEWAA